MKNELKEKLLYKSFVGSYVINIKAAESYMYAVSYSIVKLNEVLIQYSPNIVIYSIYTHKFLCYETAERSQTQTSALLLLK